MNTEHVKIKVWDLSVRIFHWSMVCLLALLWWSADIGEMQWHQIFAYSLLILIGFRILWGIIGSDTARFSHFIHHPRVALDYLKGGRTKAGSVVLGHNPIGGYMVAVLIGMISLQLVTGLFATDDIFTEGPLYSYVSSETSGLLTWLHKMNFNAILALSAIHILAVVVHAVKGDKLVGAMLSGYKKVPKAAILSSEQNNLVFKSELFALVLLAIVAAVVFIYLMWPIVQML